MNNLKPALDTCGCCDGIELLTPAKINNNHGLKTLLYRIGTHGMFKESMLRSLSDSAALKALTIREDDDSTIALIDVWAVILDVLAFYNERIINEGYILTSRERLSLVELAKHISYVPKPGVAAGSWFSFLMDESPGAPTEANVPVGTRVQSVPGQDEKPQIFETKEEIQIRTKWNTILPKLNEDQSFVKGLTSLYLDGTDAQIQAGDKIVLVGKDRLDNHGSEEWDFRTIDHVLLYEKENYTKITWRQGLGHENPITDPASSPRIYVFRQRAALFGYNAPDFKSMSKEVKNSFYETGGEDETEWDNFEITGSPPNNAIYLDALYSKLLAGSWAVLDQPGHTELYQVERVEASAQKDFTLTSKCTQAYLDTSENLDKFQRRETVIWGQSEELTLSEAPVLKPVFGRNIELDQAYPELKKDHRLMISGELVTHLQVTARERIIKSGNTVITQYSELLFFPNGSSLGIPLQTDDLLAVNDAPQPLPNNKTKWFVNNGATSGHTISGPNDLIPYIEKKDTSIPEQPSSLNQPVIVSELLEIEEQNPNVLILKEPLQHVYHRPTVAINANVAQSTHGETRAEILGSGNAAVPFQKFYLKQKPLTYISSASSTGIATTLEIRVDDIRWEEVATFYKRRSAERIYISRIEDDGTTYVQFGNGVTGTRLPSGIENIKATYRVGIGLEGILKADQLSLLMDPQLGIKSVINPVPTAGAEDPELLENIRKNAPLSVLTLDRIVSIEDFENFTSAYAGIGKARADLLWKGEDRTIHLTVASANEGPIDDTLKDNLADAINGARHDNYPVIINSFEEIPFNLKSRIKIHPDYLVDEVISRVKEVLALEYNFESRAFGQGVTPGEVIAAIQSVNGIVAVDLEELDGQDPFSIEHFRLGSNIARWDDGENNILPAELLLIDESNIEITSMDQ